MKNGRKRRTRLAKKVSEEADSIYYKASKTLETEVSYWREHLVPMSAFKKKTVVEELPIFGSLNSMLKAKNNGKKTMGGSGQDEFLCAFQTRDGGYMLYHTQI
jgi:hypothetical protein